MQPIYQYQDVVLYSDQSLEHSEGSRVWFTDGSMADLDMLTYEGDARVRFEFSREKSVGAFMHTELVFLEGADSIELEGGDVFFDLKPAPDSPPVMEIVGTEWFHNNLEFTLRPDGVHIRTPRKRSLDESSHHQEIPEGRLILKMNTLPALHVENHGCGTGRVKIPLKSLHTRIHGSMKLTCDAVQQASVQIDGSSHTTLREITDSAHLKINGFGYIGAFSGKLTDLHAAINGSGRIHASVIAEQATLNIRGNGYINVARVTGPVTQQKTGSGFISVLRR